jgi:hypothetical protein
MWNAVLCEGRFFEANRQLGKTIPDLRTPTAGIEWQNFNVLNNLSRGLPVDAADGGSAGQITSLETFAQPRTMQF